MDVFIGLLTATGTAIRIAKLVKDTIKTFKGE